MVRSFLARLPLTDRVTFVRELLSAGLYGVFSGLALPLIPIVARRIGMSPEAITAMVTMQFIGSLFGVLVGHLADRLPQMPFAVWPSLVSRALLALLAFARQPVFYLVVASAYNLLMNVGSPAYSSIMRSNYSDANRGRLMADIRIAIVIVSAACSAIAGLVLAANEDLVRWLFPVAAGFGVASSLSFSRIRVRRFPAVPAGPLPRPTPGSFRSSLVAVWRNTPFMLFLAILVLCATPDKMAVPLEPLWLVDHLRIGYGDASLLLGTVASLASIAGYYVWGRALRRVNSFTVLAVVVFIFAGRFAALGLAQSSAGLLPMSILSGLANAGWDLVPIFCMISVAEPSNFAASAGMSTTLFGIRGTVGPTLGTLLYASGSMSLPTIFLLIAGVIALGGILLLFLPRKASGRARMTARR